MKNICIKGELNPRRIESYDGNDPGYHYPINASVSFQFLNAIGISRLELIMKAD